jgi:hypothetical protein
MSDPGPSELEQEIFREEVERVKFDLEQHTLAVLKGHFNRLVYLASLRDYSTGRYHHHGLEMYFSPQAVDEGARRCHIMAFEALVSLPLKEQTEDLVSFFESLQEDKARLVQVWQHLRSYQILPPEKSHPLARQLFEKNMEIMLKVLQETDLWALLHDPRSDEPAGRRVWGFLPGVNRGESRLFSQ